MSASGLKGKRVCITGGTRGIGKAILEFFLESGARVVSTYITNDQKAQELANEWLRQGFEISFVRCDVRSRESIRAMLNIVEERLGGLDVLVNNAGINNPTDFDAITDDDWDDIMAVNVRGVFACTQEALKLMGDGSSIVNIASVSGQYGGPRTAHYAASKAALISLGQVVARFCADKGIRCNSIAAGLIESEMASGAMANAAVKKASEGILLKRFGTAQEVARVAGFLASEESSYVTAQTLNVNGGLYF